ncbi:MAG: hypothetical protein ACHQ53_14570 [Polyangiales bacterium]
MCALWLAAVGQAAPVRAQAAAPLVTSEAHAAAPAPSDAAQEKPVFALRVSGLLQVDAVVLDQASVDEVDPATGAPLNQDRFVLRRARLRTDVEHGIWRGHLTLDANTVNGPALRIFGAEIAAGWPPTPAQPQVLAAVGLFVIPFGFETVEPDGERLFLEASQWVHAFFPGQRDLGGRLSGSWRFLRGTLAVMNGEPSATAVFPLRDPNRAKDVVGRLGVDGALSSAVRVQAGSSLLLGTGFHRGRLETKDSLVWRDANEDGVVQTSEIQVIAGAPAEPSHDFDRFALGGDIVVDAELPVLGTLRVFGEVAWAKNLDRGLWPADPIAVGRDLRELGYAIGLRQSLTRHAEVGVRYDHYQPDFDATSQRGVKLVPTDASFSTIAVAAAWRTFRGGRLMLEYDHNHNPLGRGANGAPTTLAADVLTLRAQLEL